MNFSYQYFLKYLFLSIFLVASVDAVKAEKRVALVIGNASYKSSPLRNPINDATLMARTLEDAGFEVSLLTDVSHQSMKLAMVRFGRKLRSSDTVGLFYYAGHGVQVRGDNYLIPVDAEIEDESEIGVFAINVNEYLQTMERASSRINIVILDACRDNPFARSFRSQTRGLARVDAPRGTYIAYATGPGQVALDGNSGNSPYTVALVDAINTPELTLEETFKQARRDVLSKTDERQTPWETSSITGRFYFKRETSIPQISADEAAWNLVKDSGNTAFIKAYLSKYPEGKFSGSAQARLAGLAETKKIRNEDPEKLPAAEKHSAPDTKHEGNAGNKEVGEVSAKRSDSADIAASRAKSAESAWRIIQNTSSKAVLRAFITEFPDSLYSTFASARLTELSKSQKLVVARADPVQIPDVSESAVTDLDVTIDRDIDGRDLITLVQTELNRIGCPAGRPDGDWGRKSKAALKSYVQHGQHQLASLAPSRELLLRLRQEKTRICPVICSPRETAVNGQCAAKSCPDGQSLSSRGNCFIPKARKAVRTCPRGQRRSSKGICYTPKKNTTRRAPAVKNKRKKQANRKSKANDWRSGNHWSAEPCREKVRSKCLLP